MKNDELETRGRPRVAAYESLCEKAREAVEGCGMKNLAKGSQSVVSSKLTTSKQEDVRRKKHKAFCVSAPFVEFKQDMQMIGASVSAFYRAGATTIRVRKK